MEQPLAFLSFIFTWQKLLSNQSVLVAVECVTAVKEMIELVIGVSEFEEAKLPESHILEGALSVLPRDQPIGTRETHEEENPRHERTYRAVEKCV